MSDVVDKLPSMDLVMEWVKLYAPTVLAWCAIALAVSLVLRLLLALMHKRSSLLRAVSWVAMIGGVTALGGYWILTGEVPKIMDDVLNSLKGVKITVPEQLKQVDMKGLVILGAGAVMAFLSKAISHMFSRGDGAGDAEIVIKTIGWLLCVLGALMTFGVL